MFGNDGHHERCTVLASVHQPRAAVWQAFDMVREHGALSVTFWLHPSRQKQRCKEQGSPRCSMAGFA